MSDAAGGGPLRHVYVHFPFCARKCPYCDFNSHAGREAETDAYVDALLAEAGAWSERVAADTIFVGGGTPTHCSAEQLGRYAGELARLLHAGPATEFTVEANPGSLDAAKVQAMCAAGVNRLSLGAQSFHEHHLAALGRIHGVADIERGLALARAGGLARLSLDLILAVPGQTLAEQAYDVERALALGPEHVSAYVLTYEEGTVFTRRMRQGRLPAPQPERELEHLHLVCERLERAGLARYEISNFARPGAESRHNLAYWRNASWLGLGAGAHSHLAGTRWKNLDDPAAYARAVARGGGAVQWREEVPPPWQLFESLMMGLRLLDGVDLDELAARHGVDLRATHPEELDRHAGAGRVRLEGARLRPTAAGLDVINAVLADFVPDAPTPQTVEVQPVESRPVATRKGQAGM